VVQPNDGVACLHCELYVVDWKARRTGTPLWTVYVADTPGVRCSLFVSFITTTSAKAHIALEFRRAWFAIA